MGNAKSPDRCSRLRVAGLQVQSCKVRREELGHARQERGHEVHHDHLASPRRLLDVRNTGHALQHRRLDAVSARSVKRAGGRMPPAGHQALLLLLPARLAPPRLLAPGLDRSQNGTSGTRRLEPLSRFSRRAADGAAHQLWARGRHLVRRDVGQAPPDADWRLPQTYALIHRLQPATLIVPNHHRAPLPGEDVQTFEQDLPGANTAGFNTQTIGGLALETSLTMNDSWGFNLTDHNYKSLRDLIHYLVKAAGQGANLLLNIGPRPY